MEVLKDIAVVFGLIVSGGSIICVTIPNLRKSIGRWFAKKHEQTEMKTELSQIKSLLEKHISEDAAKKTDMENLKDADRSLLRDRITGIFYKGLSDGQLHMYEAEDLAYLYDAYKKLNGNTYVDSIYKQMTEEWEIVR